MVYGLWFMVYGLWFKGSSIQGLECEALWIRVEALEFRYRGPGCRIWG
jgi:hypothetical protein